MSGFIVSAELCYFVGNPSGHGCIKIGRARYVFSRLRQIQASSPVPLAILGVCPGGPAMERFLHDKFAHLRRDVGEWFSREGGAIEAYIKAETTPWEEVG